MSNLRVGMTAVQQGRNQGKTEQRIQELLKANRELNNQLMVEAAKVDDLGILVDKLADSLERSTRMLENYTKAEK
jgi:hypothetical protein